jgi:ATP/maltotriose-dependent transcriptional regulator MalT
MLHVEFSAGHNQELKRYMEGWVGGLQLFALSLTGKETSRDLNDVLQWTSRVAADYLVDGVIGAQPARVTVESVMQKEQ